MLPIVMLLVFFASAQTMPQMEFHNQPITDILLVLADIGGCSIVPDNTVKGNATFYFQELPFEEALQKFLAAFNLWLTKRDGVYFISKIHIAVHDDSSVDVDADEVALQDIIKALSKQINKTILYDQLPQGTVTLHASSESVAKVLEMLIRRSLEYELVVDESYFYLQKSRQQDYNTTRYQKALVTKNNDSYSITSPRALFADVLTQLFKSGKREYSLLMKNTLVLENIFYENKSFDQLLRLVLDMGNADFVVKDNVYYIFEVQKKDVLKKLRDTVAVKLQNMNVQNALALFPSSYDSSALVKIDKNTNTFYVTGSDEERKSVLDFLTLIDKPTEDRVFERFDVHYVPVKDVITLLPSAFFTETPTVIPDTNSFIAMVTPENVESIKEYLKIIDKKDVGYPVRLKYIKSEDLLKYLPPSVEKAEITVTGDDTLVFYTGSPSKRLQFLKQLDLIDVAKPQIRYELLVLQYQKGDNTAWSRSVTMKTHKDNEDGTEDESSFTGVLTNLLNISFDVVNQFGYDFALELNYELGENKARVLADTTLHGISGAELKFQNTNTFRYNEGVMDSDSSGVVVTTTTKEITSGLQLTVSGWVSGDGMITMKVNAEVSKQGTVSDSSTSSLPPTSEKVVTTEVRTKSGKPIIIGGLLQSETAESIHRTPFLGYLPFLGKFFSNVTTSEETTEMTIYIVPHVYTQEAEPLRTVRNIERYYTSYLSDN